MQPNFFDLIYRQQAVDNIRKAIEEYNPSSVWVNYSGGADSAIALDVALCAMQNVNVLVIDTGLASDGWVTMVMEHLAHYGERVTTRIYTGDGWEWYRQHAVTHGFGYTPMAHSIYYRRLKERAVMTHLRETKLSNFDKIIHFTGIRRVESFARMKRDVVSVNGSRVTVNPILEYDNQYANRYHKIWLDWYDNPRYKLGKNSGVGDDCGCGWTNKVSVSTLMQNSPRLGANIKALEDEVKAQGLWGYDERPSASWGLTDDATDDMPNDSLCSNCYAKNLI